MAGPKHDPGTRLELRELVESYACAVDAKDVGAVVELFEPDGRLVSHLLPGTEDEPFVRAGHAQIQRALDAGLAQYRQTTHVVGAHVLGTAGTDPLTGLTVCLAHHVYEDDNDMPRLLVMAIRYHDTYTRRSGAWRFAERRLRLDWREDSVLQDQP
ncbi:MAG: nuclear transport factor 2 family protein [Acidimicrobiales bacterium]